MARLNFYNKVKFRKGFTFIEFLIVGIIVSILIGIALLSFRGFQKATEFENTVDKIISFIHYAQTKAVTKLEKKVMLVLPDEKRLIFKLNGNNTKELKLSDHYSMESDILEIIFKPTGGFKLIDSQNPDLDVRSRGEIKIRNNTEDEVRIEVWAYAGYIKCKSGSLEKY